MSEEQTKAETPSPLIHTKEDVLLAFNLGQWIGKRLGELNSMERTMPHINKQNARLTRAGHKVGAFKNALRAQVDANSLLVKAFDD